MYDDDDDDDDVMATTLDIFPCQLSVSSVDDGRERQPCNFSSSVGLALINTVSYSKETKLLPQHGHS